MFEYKLVYKGIFSIPEACDACVITLTDEMETRAITVVADNAVAEELKAHQQEQLETEDHLVDVLNQVMCEDGADNFSFRVLIRGHRERGYLAALINSKNGKVRNLRVGEAILFAVVSGCPMYTTLDVLRNFATPYSKDVMSIAIPVLNLPTSLLQVALDKAIEEENYEGASFIRDEMKRREGKGK